MLFPNISVPYHVVVGLDIEPVPAPSAAMLIAVGSVVFAALRRQRRHVVGYALPTH